MSEEAFEALDALYAEVDQRTERLAQRQLGRLSCRRGCSGCCTDGLTVLEIEAERIRFRNPELLASGQPGLEGSCAFLDRDRSCRIYPDRPYVCRTQGLPLRWWAEQEFRDICPLNDGEIQPGGVDLLGLPSEDCFEIGPFEARLASLQARKQGVRPGAPLIREALRSLFAASQRGRV